MCECAWSGVCPWARGCRRERLSCSQMLQDTAPTVPSVSREDYENSFHCCCAVLFTLLPGCELSVKKQINQTKKVSTRMQRTMQNNLFFSSKVIQIKCHHSAFGSPNIFCPLLSHKWMKRNEYLSYNGNKKNERLRLSEESLFKDSKY